MRGDNSHRKGEAGAFSTGRVTAGSGLWLPAVSHPLQLHVEKQEKGKRGSHCGAPSKAAGTLSVTMNSWGDVTSREPDSLEALATLLIVHVTVSFLALHGKSFV